MSKFIPILSPAERAAKKRQKTNPWRDNFILSKKSKGNKTKKTKKESA